MQFSRFSQIRSTAAAILFHRAWIFVAVATILFAAHNTVDHHAAAAESELRFVDSENSLATVLQHGANLEKQQKWAEALSHYENAIKRFPNDKTLRGHQDLARIHYDLDRR